MSTVVRRRRGSRMSLGSYRRHELLTGRIQYPVQGYTSYGNGRSTNVADYISDQMKADWLANREAFRILAVRQIGCGSFSGRYFAVAVLGR